MLTSTKSIKAPTSITEIGKNTIRDKGPAIRLSEKLRLVAK